MCRNPVPVEQVVEKIVEVPVVHIRHIPVETIIEKVIEVPVERIVQRIVEVPDLWAADFCNSRPMQASTEVGQDAVSQIENFVDFFSPLT